MPTKREKEQMTWKKIEEEMMQYTNLKAYDDQRILYKEVFQPK